MVLKTEDKGMCHKRNERTPIRDNYIRILTFMILDDAYLTTNHIQTKGYDYSKFWVISAAHITMITELTAFFFFLKIYFLHFSIGQSFQLEIPS